MKLENIRVLHICSEYPYSTVYKNLVCTLDSTGCSQIVYVPLRRPELEGRHKIDGLRKTSYVYSPVFSWYTRLHLGAKVRRLVGDLGKRGALNGVDLVHAHYLFSHGGVALQLRRKLGLRYVTSVRSSDIHQYFRFAVHLRGIGIRILEEAERIILMAPASLAALTKYIPPHKRTSILNKVRIIPNGVERFWLDNKGSPRSGPHGAQVHLIYVGEFSSNKNLKHSMEAVRLLRSSGVPAVLRMIGSGPQTPWVRKQSCRFPELFSAQDRITDPHVLRERYSEADVFVMPSFMETFGLVYLEAMSQGLPIIYSRGQGFDGCYTDGTVGYAVNPHRPQDTAEAVLKILEHYPVLSANGLAAVEQFSWETVAGRMGRVYEEATGGA